MKKDIVLWQMPQKKSIFFQRLNFCQVRQTHFKSITYGDGTRSPTLAQAEARAARIKNMEND